jgi:hypothetical protein
MSENGGISVGGFWVADTLYVIFDTPPLTTGTEMLIPISVRRLGGKPDIGVKTPADILIRYTPR